MDLTLPTTGSEAPTSPFPRQAPVSEVPAARSPSRRTTLLGCPLDLITSAELLNELHEVIQRRTGPRVIQFVNANKVSQVHQHPGMKGILERADYVLLDGQPLVPMARLLGIHVPERIDGIGLMWKLLDLAHQHGHTVYLLGARRNVVAACVERITAAFPGLRIAGFRDGYFSPDETEDVLGEVRAARPDILFVGMGSPLKERLADQYRTEFGSMVIQGVGGSFDVIAGLVKRAPGWVQQIGFEWLYRVLQEPRRMFWRYARTNTTCLLLFGRALFNRRPRVAPDQRRGSLGGG